MTHARRCLQAGIGPAVSGSVADRIQLVWIGMRLLARSQVTTTLPVPDELTARYSRSPTSHHCYPRIWQFIPEPLNLSLPVSDS